MTKSKEGQNRMRNIITEGLALVGEGGEGKIYRLNEEQILKVYKRASYESVEYWFRTINAAIDYGITSAKAYEIVEAEDRYAVIFDYLDAKSVGRTIFGAPECLEEYAERMGLLLKQLHSTEDKFDLLENVDERMMRWYADSCKRNILPDNVADKLQTILESIPKRSTLLHGDFHEGNIVVRNGELVCVDLDRMGSGHPIYDLMGLYLNHDVVSKKTPDFFEKSWGLTVEQVLAVKHRLLQTYYGVTGDKQLQEYEDIVAKSFLFRRMLLPVSPLLDLDDDAARAYIKADVPTFLDIANELPDMIRSLPV